MEREGGEKEGGRMPGWLVGRRSKYRDESTKRFRELEYCSNTRLASNFFKEYCPHYSRLFHCLLTREDADGYKERGVKERRYFPTSGRRSCSQHWRKEKTEKEISKMK